MNTSISHMSPNSTWSVLPRLPNGIPLFWTVLPFVVVNVQSKNTNLVSRFWNLLWQLRNKIYIIWFYLCHDMLIVMIEYRLQCSFGKCIRRIIICFHLFEGYKVSYNPILNCKMFNIYIFILFVGWLDLAINKAPFWLSLCKTLE